MSFVSGSLYERLGAKVILSAGAAFQLAGLALLALIDDSWGYAQAVPGMFLFGIGVGLFISTVTTSAVTALDESRASLGGAILDMFQVAGGSLGLGISTSIFASAANAKLDSDASAAGLPISGDEIRDVQGILAGTDTAQQVARHFPGQAKDITGLVSDAFIAGLQSVLIVCAVVAAVGLVVTILFVGGRLRLGGAKAAAREPAA